MHAPLSFGQRLAEARRRAGYTQAELAALSGVSAKAISAVETGERPSPGIDTVCALARALGMNDAECGQLICPALPRAA